MAEKKVEPHLFVIFGATGDLAKRKLMPAIAMLAQTGKLGERYAILGVGRGDDIDDDGFRALVNDALREAGIPSGTARAWCERCLHYQKVSYQTPDDFAALGRRIEELERENDLPGNRVFYLSTPPAVFELTIDGLGQAGLNQGPGWTRLVIEKPFGHNLQSAIDLNACVHRHFTESQIYRIDHYLGKATVQNLFVFRFANMLFEAIWNRDRIASVDILVAEEIGVGSRAGFYEKTGAVKDILQNHAMQLFALIAMEPPSNGAAEAIRSEKIKLLYATQPLREEDIVLGQYTPGVINGREVKGYHEEPGIAPDSLTETFAAVRLRVNNWRWQGVPFIVRTGKRLRRRVTQIAVNFRTAPVWFFETMGQKLAHPNSLILRLQPNEGFELGIQVKDPNQPERLRTVPLIFDYADTFGRLPEAYETLLLDTLVGDQTLFVHGVETEAAWRIFEPFVESQPKVHGYAAGTWGPEAMARLMPRNRDEAAE